MAPTTSTAIKFIDAALSCTDNSISLSYKDPKQKCLIRKHLRSLLHEFKSLSLSIDTFTHNNGTTVNLFNVNGFLPVSSVIAPAPIVIWIHEDYPYEPPLVFFLLTSTTTILRDHTYVNSSGTITTPYLKAWHHPRSNLVSMVRNLVRLLSDHHSFVDPTLVLKMEALDLLVATLHSDIVTLEKKTEEEIEALSRLQAELIDRADILTAIFLGIEHERSSLKQMVNELTEEADVLMNWLIVNDPGTKFYTVRNETEATFEAADEKSEWILNNLAAEEAIEDVIYALDKALEEGAVNLREYLKKVKILSREQFFHKAMLDQLRSSDVQTP